MLALSLLFLANTPPAWAVGAGAGAGAATAAVAVQAARTLLGPSLRHTRDAGRHTGVWRAYVAAGATAAALVDPYLVLVLLGCGLLELGVHRRLPTSGAAPLAVAGGIAPTVMASGGLAALARTAFKVGALSFGGGFVIIPLMQTDAVTTYHWVSDAQFLNAVALGQVTRGPVTSTVAAIGYAAHGLAGGLLAAGIALIGAPLP